MPKTHNVFVTGGADSVGRVIAERFSNSGARVHICDVRADALEQTLRDNPKMQGTLADVGDAACVERAFSEARNWLGDVSVLVNNVGIAGPRGPMEEVSCNDWDRTICVNLSGMFYCMRQVIPGMKKRRDGVIINFSTGSTRTRLPLRAAYVASKAAVEGLTLNAARELGPYNIRCNAILPGMINNERMKRIVANSAATTGRSELDVERDYLKYISLQTKIEPEELADMVEFLASDKALKVTGELIAVSGNVEWEI
jgi:NAD(P)-dependent dehydrogenase (short-subunit alcohol dehydrogenase family)